MNASPSGQRPSPARSDTSAEEFFDGCRAEVFLLRRSVLTGELLDPRAEQDDAGNTALEWTPAAGTATLISWAVVHKPATDVRPAHTVTVGIVELDEGPWWWTRLVDIDPPSITTGMTMRVAFVASDANADDKIVPVFTLDTPARD